MKNALAISKRARDAIFTSVQRQFALLYLHDMAFFIKTLTDYIEKDQRVPRFLYEAGGPLQKQKCKLSTKAMGYVEQLIQPATLK